MRSRAEIFDDLVVQALEDIEGRLGRSLALEIVVDDVPPHDPHERAEGVALATLDPGDRRRGARLLIFRRPVEARAGDHGGVGPVIEHLLADHVAQWLGLDPEELL